MYLFVIGYVTTESVVSFISFFFRSVSWLQKPSMNMQAHNCLSPISWLRALHCWSIPVSRWGFLGLQEASFGEVPTVQVRSWKLDRKQLQFQHVSSATDRILMIFNNTITEEAVKVLRHCQACLRMRHPDAARESSVHIDVEALWKFSEMCFWFCRVDETCDSFWWEFPHANSYHHHVSGGIYDMRLVSAPFFASAFSMCLPICSWSTLEFRVSYWMECLSRTQDWTWFWGIALRHQWHTGRQQRIRPSICEASIPLHFPVALKLLPNNDDGRNWDKTC